MKLEKGDIIIEKSGGSPNQPVGRVIFFNEDGTYLTSNFTSILRPKGEVHPKYLLYLLLANHQYGVTKLFQNKTTGIINLQLTRYIKELQIPLPPLPIQKKIAAILDTADVYRQKTKALIEKYDQLTQSLFLEMFGDPAKNMKKWDVHKLHTLMVQNKEATKCGPFGSALKKYEYADKGICVWTMDNIQGSEFNPKGCLYITEEKYSSLSNYATQPGDIIISRAGTVGKMCVIPRSSKIGIISTNLIRLRLDPDKLLPVYFVKSMTWFGSRVGKLRTGEDGTFTHMNTGILNDLEIATPPIEMQLDFSCHLERINDQIIHLIKSLEKAEALFRSLLQRAFKGSLV